MIKVRVVAGLREMEAQMRRIEREQLPFATGTALTRTAKFVASKIKEELPRAFDRPTPWVLNSLYVKPANKRVQVAEVKVKDSLNATGAGQPPVNTVGPHIYSGPRNIKRSEVLLKNAGLMFPDQYIVPASGARLDRYGNISRGQLQQILSGLSAQFDSYQNTKKGSKRKGNSLAGRIFAIRSRTTHLAPGVYQRVGEFRLRPLLLFVLKPNYRKRLRFFELAEQISAMRFRIEFAKAMRESVRFALAKG